MPADPLQGPILFAKHHDVASFDRGKAPLNDFLITYALHNQASGGARTYVLLRNGRVVAYYSLAPASSVTLADAPARVVKGQGRYAVPVTLTARFAVAIAPGVTVLSAIPRAPSSFAMQRVSTSIAPFMDA